MVVGPIPLFNPLMRPVKYVSASGVIVLTRTETQFLVVPGNPPKVSKLNLPNTKNGPIAFATCGSSHSGVIVICCGVHVVETADEAFANYVSRDGGKTWQIAWDKTVEETTTASAAMVWSGDSFRQSYVVITFPEHAPRATTEYEHSSKDGKIWGSTITVGEVPTDEPGGYRSPFPGKYCGQNDCVDAFGQHVPDGIMYGTAGSFILRPVPPISTAYSNGRQVGDGSSDGGFTNVIEFREGDKTVKKNVPIIEGVYCVSGKGGWFAGGGGGLVYSSNSGTSWVQVNLGEERTTVVGLVPVSG